MVDNCRGCGRALPNKANYCPSCGVGVGSIRISLWQLWKRLLSRISPAIPREVSDLEDAETSYRVKLATVSWWETWSQLANGLIKALPTVIIANAILLFVTSRTTSADEGPSELVVVPGYTLAAFSIMFLMAIIGTRKIDRLLTRYRRQAKVQDAEVKALRKMTIKKFLTYKEQMMPRIKPEDLRPDMLLPEGTINRTFVTENWRKNRQISTERQNDMDHLDHKLVSRMDELVSVAGFFADAFDDFALLCYGELTRWKSSDSDGSESEFSFPTAVQALYRFFCEEIPNVNDLEWGVSHRLIDYQGSQFLKQFFKGDPSNMKNVASLQMRADLRERAKNAREAQNTALKQYEKVEIDLEAKTYLEY